MTHVGAGRGGARTQEAVARWHGRRWRVGAGAGPAGAKRGSVPRAVRGQGAPGPQASRHLGVGWAVAAPVRERPVAALRAARGVPLAQATLQRWGVPSRLPVAEACHWRQRPVWGSGRLDETACLRPHRATPGPRHPLMDRGNWPGSTA